jgi:hypothetical protein
LDGLFEHPHPSMKTSERVLANMSLTYSLKSNNGSTSHAFLSEFFSMFSFCDLALWP